jgi:hypothetical protein
VGREKLTPMKRNSLKPFQEYEIQRPINAIPYEKLKLKNPSTQKCFVKLEPRKGKKTFAVKM